MPAPRIYPPDIAEQRKREIQRRSGMRDREALKLLRRNHPRLYEKARAEAAEIIDKQRGPLPGGEKE